MKTEKQDRLWNELSEESKEHILSINKELDKEYEKYKKEGEDSFASTRLEKLIMLEDLFGEHNLNPKPLTPKTWEDVQKIYNEWPRTDLDDKIDKMCSAATKIAKLIDLGYGGMVSEEEWKNDITRYCITRKTVFTGVDYDRYEKTILKEINTFDYHFIAFHTPEQREEFMSYESNRSLIKQYFMM